MSTHKVIKELLDENLIGAKKEIEDLLYEKLGEHLNEAYDELAPTLLGEAKKKKGKKKKSGKKGKKPDFLDQDEDGDTEESWTDAEEDKKEKGMKEEADPKALRPNAAPTDEPGDLTHTKKKILAALGKEKGSSNSGTGAY